MIEYLFPTPIYYSEVDNLNEVQKELSDCVESIDFRMNPAWGKTHHLSDPCFKTNLIHHYNLKVFMKTLDLHLSRYCSESGLSFKPYKISSSWMSLFKQDNYGHIHNHGGVDISGVYYFKTNQEDGKIFFLCPTPSMESSFHYQDLANRWEHKPMVGKLLLFPGWLSHGIETNETKDDRISLSFNINFFR
tara:strand:+ start:133 stop:702 length:570 start_codon:yes stop_codon:yes gene_type:complete